MKIILIILLTFLAVNAQDNYPYDPVTETDIYQVKFNFVDEVAPDFEVWEGDTLLIEFDAPTYRASTPEEDDPGYPFDQTESEYVDIPNTASLYTDSTHVYTKVKTVELMPGLWQVFVKVIALDATESAWAGGTVLEVKNIGKPGKVVKFKIMVE